MRRFYRGFMAVIALSSVSAIAQPPMQAVVTDRFAEYSKKIIREKLFLHTDREFYVAGELMWFRVYYTEAVTHQPLSLSKIAYVEVLDDKNRAVLQTMVSLQPGADNGSFYLPASLSTGYYTVRAYTSWMKNFETTGFFTKRITVVNTLKNPQETPPDTATGINAGFFPEGGHLVANTESRVGFRVVNDKGGVNSYKGVVVNGRGDTITSFAPLKAGMGSFSFRPVAGDTYKGIIVLPDGTRLTRSLPAVQENGYSIKVADKPGDRLSVTVYRKRVPGEQNTESVLLAVHAKQALRITEQAFISHNDSAVFLVDKKKAGAGVIYFTLFNSSSQPVCERLFFIRPPADAMLTVSTDKQVYDRRGRIDLSLNVQSAASLNLSASVFRLDSLQEADQFGIIEYMWLLSELPEPVENPRYYFSSDPGAAAAVDHLMLTQGWRTFNWDNLTGKPDTLIRYLPEINGHLVAGRVTDTRTGKPAAGITVHLSVPGPPFGFYTAKSDADGVVLFEVKDFYGHQPLIIQPGMDTDSLYRVTIIQPYAGKAVSVAYPSYRFALNAQKQLLQKSIGMQAQYIYTGDSLRNFLLSAPADTLPFYGRSGIAYRLDDYKRFTTMEEVLREYVSQAGVSVKNGKPVFRLFNPAMHDFYEGRSLVLVNGIPLRNPDQIFNYDPLKIRGLDIVQNRYVAGQSVFNGIASFITYDDFNVAELDPGLVTIDYEGLQLRRQFYSPAYRTKQQLENRIPDFRSTLFWQPDISIHGEGNAGLQFYASDLPGQFIVIVQGMDKQGRLVFASTDFGVK